MSQVDGKAAIEHIHIVNYGLQRARNSFSGVLMIFMTVSGLTMPLESTVAANVDDEQACIPTRLIGDKQKQIPHLVAFLFAPPYQALVSSIFE